MDILKRALYPIDGNDKITIEDIVNEASSGDEVADPVTVDTLTGATAIGKSLMKAASQEVARTVIGAGTGNSNLALGTTSSTAKAGNYQPTWEQVTNKPAVIGAGATDAEARQAIGAGTSNLALGTTATTAMAGDTPIPAATTWDNLSGKPSTFPPTIGTTAQTAKAGNYTPAVAEVTGLQAALDAKATAAALADLVSRVEILEAATEG